MCPTGQFSVKVILDVVSLFTKVPTDETHAVVRDKLTVDSLLKERTNILIDYLMEMLTLFVETTYFGIGSDIYRQEGLAIGSPLSPTLQNIYMEYFEEIALGAISLKPSTWLWYVDDTLFSCCISIIQLHVYKYTREHNQLIMTTSITNEYTSF